MSELNIISKVFFYAWLAITIVWTIVGYSVLVIDFCTKYVTDKECEYWPSWLPLNGFDLPNSRTLFWIRHCAAIPIFSIAVGLSLFFADEYSGLPLTPSAFVSVLAFYAILRISRKAVRIQTQLEEHKKDKDAH